MTVTNIEYTKEIVRIKRTVKTRSRVRSATIELCLCPTCARAFYNSPHHFIRRINPFQTVLEPCTFCSDRNGYDFLVFDLVVRTNREEETCNV